MWRTLPHVAAAFLVEAKVGDKGTIPVGLATVVDDGKALWPHFDWFWWASRRNVLEGMVKFFLKLGEDNPFMIRIDRKSAAHRICMHLRKYGIMRHIGTSYNWEPDKVVSLFETRI